jgi:hypothetical protein
LRTRFRRGFKNGFRKGLRRRFRKEFKNGFRKGLRRRFRKEFKNGFRKRFREGDGNWFRERSLLPHVKKVRKKSRLER